MASNFYLKLLGSSTLDVWIGSAWHSVHEGGEEVEGVVTISPDSPESCVGFVLCFLNIYIHPQANAIPNNTSPIPNVTPGYLWKKNSIPITNNNEIHATLKCQEPSPVYMQIHISTCPYLISTCGIRRVCHFSQNG